MNSLIKKANFFFFFILPIFFLAFYSYGNKKNDTLTKNSETVSGTVATVNGIPITLLDVINVCGNTEVQLPYMHNERELKEQIHILRTVALEKIIKRKLVFCDFVSKGYQFPFGFMQNYLDKIAVGYKLPNAAALQKKIEGEGGNFEDFKREAYEEAAVNSLVYTKCYKNVFITPREIYEYYNANKGSFTKPARVELQILKVDKKGVHRKDIDIFADKLKTELENANAGKFHDYVLMYSEGPNNQKSGNIGWIPVNKLRKDFAVVLNNTEIGDVVGPVKADEGYYFIRVNNRMDEFTEPYRYIREDIKEQLTQGMRQKEYDEYIDSLRRKASIKYF